MAGSRAGPWRSSWLQAGWWWRATGRGLVAQRPPARQGARGRRKTTSRLAWARRARRRHARALDLADPFAAFDAWFAEASGTGAERCQRDDAGHGDAGGRPSARMVLLKGGDDRAASCSTPTSKAARARNWRPTHRRRCCSTGSRWRRQVRIEGAVEDGDRCRGRRVFRHRGARISRLGALGVGAVAAAAGPADAGTAAGGVRGAIPGREVPRPPHWSGYRVLPERIEFWQGMPFRLHDRRGLHARGRRLGGRAGCIPDRD